MSDYKIIEFLAEGLMLTKHPRYGQQMWGVSKLTKKHKNDACAMCGLSVGDKAYRPVSNLSNRAQRICLSHESLK